MYRPEGWKNPYKDNHKPHTHSWERLCYERGADAMLEALTRVYHVKAQEVIDFAPEDTFTSDCNGYLVFIPDETS